MIDTRPAPSPLAAQLDHLTRLLRGNGDGQSPVGLAALCVGLVGLFSVLMPDRFPTLGTAQSMMFQLPELGLLALAMVIPLISSGLNLAIIATANQSALLMAFIMTKAIAPGSEPAIVALWIAVALAAGFVHCLVVGLATGWLVANMGVHPILVTLGTMSIIDGVSIYLTRGLVIAGFPDAFQAIGNAVILGLPLPFLIFVAVAALVAVILSRTPFGISVAMIGSNLEATRYSGVDTKRVLIGVYTMSSVLCFVAAVLMMARFNSASAGYAQSYLLVTILAAVLGGVDPNGGFGRVSGLVMALIVLQVISSGLNQLGANQHLTLAIWGLTLIGVMAIRSIATALAQRRSARGTSLSVSKSNPTPQEKT
ncbi:ABC transporter permease [Methyloraptor flagellatus]|uniref:ABC transporter permease n=1 Tax=Methyloraptor flagellatus TaxID=3162530 RepID=A0AAU7XE89_9HYPH